MSKQQRENFTDWPLRSVDVIRKAEIHVRMTIRNDKDYTLLRNDISPEIRHQCDVRRYQEWRKLGSPLIDAEPLKNILPASTLSIRLDSYSLTVRVNNVLRRLEINTIGDLSNYSIMEALKWPNLGRKSLSVLLRMLDDVVRDSPSTTAEQSPIMNPKNGYSEDLLINSFERDDSKKGGLTDISPVDNARLYEQAVNWLDTLPDRNCMIMKARYGFNAPPLTLQVVGTKFEITRERVRQIEAKMIRKVRQDYGFPEEMVSRLRILLRGRVAPLLVDAIWMEDAWFSGFAERPHFLQSIIEHLSNREFRVASNKGLRFISRLSQDDWKELVNSAKNIAKIAHQQRWVRKDFDIAIEGLTAQKQADELTSFLKDSISSKLHFARTKDGCEVVVGYGYGVEHMVSVILNESEQPLHYSEIHRRVIRKYRNRVDIRRVHGAVQRIDAILFSLGTYGLEKHVQLSEHELEILRSTSEDAILASEQVRQWHSTELVDVVIETHPEMEGRIDQYMVNYALRNSNALVYLGRNVWGLSKSRHLSSKARIEVNEAFIAILRDAGQPLHADELMKRLIQSRGVSGVCQIHANDRIVPIKRATWGLMGRDVVLGKGGLTEVMDRLYVLVKEIGHGIDRDAMRRIIEDSNEDWGYGVNEYVLFTLVGFDPRFAIHNGQAIFLQEWSNPRYKTIRELVRQVVENIVLPAHIDNIVSEVQRITSRTITRDHVYGYLRDLGLRYNENIQMWEIIDSEEVAE